MHQFGWLSERGGNVFSLLQKDGGSLNNKKRKGGRGFQTWRKLCLSINSKDIEAISVELLYEKKRNTLFNVVYRPPNGKIEPFENILKILFNKNKNSNKNYHIAGDFNLNLLDHDKNKKVLKTF